MSEGHSSPGWLGPVRSRVLASCPPVYEGLACFLMGSKRQATNPLNNRNAGHGRELMFFFCGDMGNAFAMYANPFPDGWYVRQGAIHYAL